MLIPSFPHLFLLSLLSFSSATEFSYSQHCSLIVPESVPELSASNLSFPLSQFHTGYGGSQGFFNQTSSFSKLFVFRTQNSYYTLTRGLLKVEADFIFPAPFIFNQGIGKSLIRLSLSGFWSESSAKLCMIGSCTSGHDCKAVLKLQNVRNSSNVSSLITGTLECLNLSTHFRPISILMLPQMSYEYSLIPEQIQPATNLPFSPSSMPGPSFCNEGWWPPNGFDLKYDEKSCKSANSCSPFGNVMPPALFITGFGCSDEERRLRILVEFSKTSCTDFYPNTTLVGEGYWDEKKLSIVACRFISIAASESCRVADCSIRISLTFSDTLSVRKTGNLIGKIWSNRMKKDPDYFDSIMFYSSENRIVGVPGLKYTYTETDRVKRLCTKTQSLEYNGARHPGNSISMRFEMYASTSGGKVGSGYASPFSIGDKFYVTSAVEEQYRTLVNISYKIGLSRLPNAKLGRCIFRPNKSSMVNQAEISAEGIYNENSGRLCMVGCRNLEQSLDCEILLKFQFSPPLGIVKGRIESIRERSDPLYFDPLETLSTAAYSITEAQKVIWRVDMEMVIGFISSTLSCVFVGLQCLHGNKQPEVIPLVSTFMLSILALGNLLRLAANLGSLLLETSDKKHQLVGIGESVEVKDLMLCLLEMVVFFFQFHLLQLTWNARSRDIERSKRLWICEKNSLLVCVPIYAGMGLVGWPLNSCKDVVLNGFLVPQIMVNILRESKEIVVSCYFYMGTTLINLLPQFYNVYEAYACAYVSLPVWEIVVISEGVVFAAVMNWQQRYGSSYFPSLA